ncbi:MAG: class I SAM-dependent methyltransferase [Phycisphaerales bacterium]|nr:class I SAM-dependent methyltransferase [Phycisphaerales bacterium]
MTTEQPKRVPGQPTYDERGRPIYAAKRVWPAYFDVVRGKPPRDTLIAALEALDREGLGPAGAEAPLAVDIGCGDGRDTVEILRRGWRVLAVDGHPDAFDRMIARADLAGRDRLECLHAPFEGLELPRTRLINASFSLPFCDPGHFGALWAGIVEALEPGGRFAGQLFGDRDDWASLEGRTHHTVEQARALLAGLEVERFEETEAEGKDALGNPKHWHRFDIVARNPHPDRKGTP